MSRLSSKRESVGGLVAGKEAGQNLIVGRPVEKVQIAVHGQSRPERVAPLCVAGADTVAPGFPGWIHQPETRGLWPVRGVRHKAIEIFHVGQGQARAPGTFHRHKTLACDIPGKVRPTEGPLPDNGHGAEGFGIGDACHHACHKLPVAIAEDGKGLDKAADPHPHPGGNPGFSPWRPASACHQKFAPGFEGSGIQHHWRVAEQGRHLLPHACFGQQCVGIVKGKVVQDAQAPEALAVHGHRRGHENVFVAFQNAHLNLKICAVATFPLQGKEYSVAGREAERPRDSLQLPGLSRGCRREFPEEG